MVKARSSSNDAAAPAMALHDDDDRPKLLLEEGVEVNSDELVNADTSKSPFVGNKASKSNANAAKDANSNIVVMFSLLLLFILLLVITNVLAIVLVVIFFFRKKKKIHSVVVLIFRVVSLNEVPVLGMAAQQNQSRNELRNGRLLQIRDGRATKISSAADLLSILTTALMALTQILRKR